MNALAADAAPPINPTSSTDFADSGNADQARFAALFDEHGDRVFRLCLRLCGARHAEAEDLAQDALIAAFRSLPRFAGRARVTTWLYAVTLRTCQKQRRATRAKLETLTLQESDENRASISDVAMKADASNAADSHLTRLTIDAAISALPDPLREAFVLVKVEGLTHREAAGLMGLPQGTVQARVHEAARRLRAALHDTFRDE